MNIYLAGAIDYAQASSHELFSKISNLIVSTVGFNATVFNPFSAFNNANKAKLGDNFVVGVNMKALAEADLGVFIWSGCPSFGVPIEAYHRTLLLKPNLVYNLSGKPPGIYMRYSANSEYGSSIVDTEDAFVAYLKGFSASDAKFASRSISTMINEESD